MGIYSQYEIYIRLWWWGGVGQGQQWDHLSLVKNMNVLGGTGGEKNSASHWIIYLLIQT